MNTPTEAEQIQITCRMLERTMKEAQQEERKHEIEEGRARALKESARARKDTTRGLILLYDPSFLFSSERGEINLPVTEKLPLPVMVSTTPKESVPIAGASKPSRKDTYGRHTFLARNVMAVVKEGKFPRIVSVGQLHNMLPDPLSEKDSSALRGALHGLARRKEILYKDGVFTYKQAASSI